MAAIVPVLESNLEDVLAHLPISSTTEYGKWQTIYGQHAPAKCIFLVVSGKVAISRVTEDGSEVILEIVGTDDLFGESSFLGAPRISERATAIEKTTVMTWPVAEIEELITKRPRLAVALLQILAQRNAELTERIESFAVDGVERRLARSLLRFSERLGAQEQDGSVRMMPFTHALLSRYVGTSREVVTQHMNRLRKQGYVSYSRHGIVLHRDALKASIS
ncbi:MAG TPA: Crp/Fnr family transcriptional regulator [Bryobacteraceae bacterium]|nr:Crp/Fnr family transcriptional regulator [Bryobacteraceae bacterium]